MNERIKELATEAFGFAYNTCKEANHTVGNVDSFFISFAMGKYAELILKECDTIVSAMENPNQEISKALKEHFGIDKSENTG